MSPETALAVVVAPLLRRLIKWSILDPAKRLSGKLPDGRIRRLLLWSSDGSHKLRIDRDDCRLR